MKEFTKEELKKYNGQDGQPAYVAKDGKVYDVSGSRMWGGGKHMGKHVSGDDLTTDFESAPHGADVLERDSIKQVGVLVSGAATSESAAENAPAAAAPVSAGTPAWAEFILGFHPHPIMVHFPQGAFVFAPVFLALFYITKEASFERTALYMVCAGVLTALPAFLTGIFHWVFKYMKAPGGIYMFKLLFSQVLIFLSLITAYLHFKAGVLPADKINVTLLVLYFLLIPVAAAIGHAGGIIVFGKGK